MTNLEEKINSLTFEELCQCWDEFEEFRKTGVTGHTLIRELYEIWIDQCGQGGIPWIMVEICLYRVMAKMWVDMMKGMIE